MLLIGKYSFIKEISELKDQVRDLMFFLEAQNTIDKSANRDDILNGSLIVDEQNQSSGPSKTRKHKKQR